MPIQLRIFGMEVITNPNPCCVTKQTPKSGLTGIQRVKLASMWASFRATFRVYVIHA